MADSEHLVTVQKKTQTYYGLQKRKLSMQAFFQEIQAGMESRESNK